MKFTVFHWALIASAALALLAAFGIIPISLWWSAVLLVACLVLKCLFWVFVIIAGFGIMGKGFQAFADGLSKFLKVAALAALVPAANAADALIWNPSPDINTYRVYIQPDTGPATRFLVLTNTHPLTGLTAGVRHTIFVTAISPKGYESDPSAPVEYTPALPPLPPEPEPIPAPDPVEPSLPETNPPPPPIILSGSVNRAGNSNLVVSLSWRAPTKKMGVTGHHVIITQGGKVAATLFSTNTAAEVTLPLKGQTTVSLVASNKFGVSVADPILIFNRLQ